ncbi:hypothetical protein B2J69_08295 [Pantoea latae]|uniref:Uncharacterized protein n=1 Tax=Pantoea latae TaxID=1964541 RepID=A0A1V9DLS0_9GAMM|nr:hypothetical protein B2J69_08295 [Pantoea latae]
MLPGISSLAALLQPKSYRENGLAVIFCAAAALAALGYPSHILMYAPGDILACRLASAQKL